MKWLRRLFAPPPESASAAPAVDHTQFLRTLEDLGFLSRATADQTAAVRADIRERGWGGIFSHDGRFFPADAEDLAEGGVAGFLETISGFLAAEGVRVPRIEEEHSESGYALRWDGERDVIWDATDLAREESEPGRLWGIAPVRAFALVNRWLGSAGSPERLYAVNGGNDLFGLFLTPDQFAAIASYAGQDRRGAPYEAKDEPPWYGGHE